MCQCGHHERKIEIQRAIILPPPTFNEKHINFGKSLPPLVNNNLHNYYDTVKIEEGTSFSLQQTGYKLVNHGSMRSAIP